MTENILLIVLFVFLSGFFSASEMAYLSVPENRLAKKKNNSFLDKCAYYAKTHFSFVLPSILIGNSLVNIEASSTSTVIFVDLAGNSGPLISTITMTIIILLFGEIVPKAVAKRTSEKFSKYSSLPLLVLSVVLAPVNFVLNLLMKIVDLIFKPENTDSVSEGELKAALEIAEDEDVIDEDQEELLTNTLDFPEITAEDILTPRVDVIAIDINWSPKKILEIALDSPYSRLPVYDGKIDNIIGALTLNRLFRAAVGETRKPSIRKLITPVSYVYKTMPLPQVLADCRRKHTNIASVYGEYGEFLGIVTLEDVIEQLVGEIWDETDTVEPEIVEVSEGKYRISGDMLVEDADDELDIGIDEDDYDSDTMGGLAIEVLKKFPREGDSFQLGHWVFTVDEVDDRRVELLTAVREPEKDGGEDEQDED
ncbi:MAG: hemolysin family protein [Oscillospiraceae bacterium]|jgi:putative hemolysin